MEYRLLSKYRAELMGCAMLWVMLFHAFDLDLGFAPLNYFRAAGFGGVDVFIVLSAMGLVMSFEKKVPAYDVFMARRASRILPAYFAVMLPYTLWCILRRTAAGSTLLWNSLLLNYWVRAEGGFNWYVSGIMLFYAIAPFWLRRLKASKRRELLTAVGVAAGIGICRLLLSYGGWSYLDVGYRLPVFLLGLLVGLYCSEERKLAGKDLVFWIVWTAAGAGYLVAAGLTDPDVFYLPLCHLFLFTTVPMCLAACVCFERLPLGWLRRGLRLMGEHSLEIYLLNVSVFSEHDVWQRYLDIGSGHYIYYLTTIALNIALGVLLHRLLRRPGAEG